MARNELTPDLSAQLEALHEEGRAIFSRFERDVRNRFHSFKPANYPRVVECLLEFTGESATFLEWGSATGVIAITADLLGFEAYGIEIDASLVDVARDLARRHGSTAKFVTGSQLPDGYEWRSPTGDSRLGMIENGESGYVQLGMSLTDFDLVYGYPWAGDAGIMQDIMQQRGRDGSFLLLNGGASGIDVIEIRNGNGSGRTPSRPPIPAGSHRRTR